MKVPRYECEIYSIIYEGRMAFLEANIETEVSECQDSTNEPNRPHFQGVKEVSLHSTPKTFQIP